MLGELSIAEHGLGAQQIEDLLSALLRDEG
jgi:hypothetical protein